MINESPLRSFLLTCLVLFPLLWTVGFLTIEGVTGRTVATHGRSKVGEAISPIALICWIAAPIFVYINGIGTADGFYSFELASLAATLFALSSIPTLHRTLHQANVVLSATTLVLLLLVLWAVHLPYSWALVTVVNQAIETAPTLRLKAKVGDKYASSNLIGQDYEIRVTEPARGRDEWLSVESALYKHVGDGQIICLVLHRGILGMHWVTPALCPVSATPPL
jgi:hypothetical protein